MSGDKMFGGNPLMVILRLLLLSIVVGVVLSALGITPRNFLFEIEMLISRIVHLGIDSFDWVLQYLVLGAMVVVPVWIVVRVFGLVGGSGGGAKGGEGNGEPR